MAVKVREGYFHMSTFIFCIVIDYLIGELDRCINVIVLEKSHKISIQEGKSETPVPTTCRIDFNAFVEYLL